MNKESVIQAIGENLKNARKACHLTQQDLADKARVSKSIVSKLENGRTLPALPVLITLVRQLGITFDEVFSGVVAGEEKPYLHIKNSDYSGQQKEDAKGFEYRYILSKPVNGSYLEAALLIIHPHSYREPVQTDAWEFKYMVKGSIHYQIENSMVILEEGDSLLYDGRNLHVPMNRTGDTAVMLVLYLYYTK